MIVSLWNTKIINLATPGAVPIDFGNLGVTVPQLNASGRSRSWVRSTAWVYIDGTVWSDCSFVDIGRRYFTALISVFVELAPDVLLGKNITLFWQTRQAFTYQPVFPSGIAFLTLRILAIVLLMIWSVTHCASPILILEWITNFQQMRKMRT